MDMSTTELAAIAAGLGWASGLRLYAVVFLTGLAGRLGWVDLPAGLELLQTLPLLAVSGSLLMVEFLADKLPWVDSMWDAANTFVRIPAGAALAAGVFGWDHAQAATIAALLGGTLAATAHTAKASTRAMVNTSPEPFSNIALSLAGDAMVPGLLWLSWEYPTAFFVALAVGVVAMGVVIVLLVRFLRALVQRGFKRPPRAV